MLRNYILVALRALRRHPLYALLNVAGMAVGMACCLMIGSYVREELSYDRFHAHADRLYRLTTDGFAAAQPPAAAALIQDFPGQVEAAARLWPTPAPATIRRGSEAFVERGVSFADPAVFDVFTLPVREGDARAALSAPHSIVLTASLADKYFGDASALGQSVEFWGEAYTVTAVIEDLPAATHYPIDALVSMASLEPILGNMMDNWQWAGFYTYVLLREGTTARDLAPALASFFERHTDAPLETPQLQRVTDIHLHSDLKKEVAANGSAAYTYLLATIALLVLVVACINFVNLTTAYAGRRAREIGMRKALGARRGQLVVQFLGEAVLLSLAAFAVAVGLTWLAQPLFAVLAGQPFDVSLDAPTLAVLVGLGIVVGLAAGSYPALVLSGFRPVAVLKGQGGLMGGGGLVRKTLVVGQFAVSIGLVAGALVVFQQLHHLQNQSLGFDAEHLVVTEAGRAAPYLAALAEQPGVVSAAATGSVPGQRMQTLPLHTDAMPADSAYDIRVMNVGFGFLETMGIRMAEGRSLSRAHPSDVQEGFVLNEAAARKLGAAVGTPVALYNFSDDGAAFDVSRSGTVVGVTEDFNYASLHSPIEPLVVQLTEGESLDYVVVRLHSGDVRSGLAQVEAAWQQSNPGDPFDASFLDDQLDEQYRTEQRLSRIFAVFTGLALFVALLGLFGMTAHALQQRTREIGIRKALGATPFGLVVRFSKEVLVLLGIAFVVATPIAYAALNQWLDGFAYRVRLTPAVFLMAGAFAIGVGLLTVGVHAYRAAWANPVKSLRYE